MQFPLSGADLAGTGFATGTLNVVRSLPSLYNIKRRNRNCQYYSLYNINPRVWLSPRPSRETPMPCSNPTNATRRYPAPILPDSYYVGFDYHRQHRSIENGTCLRIMNNSHLRNDVFMVDNSILSPRFPLFPAVSSISQIRTVHSFASKLRRFLKTFGSQT